MDACEVCTVCLALELSVMMTKNRRGCWNTNCSAHRSRGLKYSKTPPNDRDGKRSDLLSVKARGWVYHLRLSGVPNSGGTESVASHALDWHASPHAG